MPDKLLAPLASGNLAKTAQKAVKMLATGIDDKGNDKGIVQWLDAGNGYRRRSLEEQLENGLVEGRKLLIKTFTATRFSGSSKGRRMKKAIKAEARKASATDEHADADRYYKILKTRAMWLKND